MKECGIENVVIEATKPSQVALRDGTLNAIAYFAMLAFPDKPDQRREFVDDCVTVICGEWADGRPERKKALSATLRKKYGVKKPLYETGRISKALFWIPRRLLIADAAAALVINSIAVSSKLPIRAKVNDFDVSNIKGITDVIWDVAPSARSQLGESTTRYHQRWLKPTKPVLHLAMALRVLLNTEGGPRLASASDMFSLFLAPGWVTDAIRCAETLRTILPLVPQLRIEAAVLLPLKWEIVQKVAIE